MANEIEETFVCVCCGNRADKVQEFERHVLVFCSHCSAQTRLFKQAAPVEKTFEAKTTYYDTKVYALKLRQNSSIRYTGPTGSWLPMGSWGRWIGKSKRATITLNLREHIKGDCELHISFKLPERGCDVPQKIRVQFEDRNIMRLVKKSPDDELYVLDIPREYVACKKKIDINIYLEELYDEHVNGEPQQVALGVTGLCLVEKAYVENVEKQLLSNRVNVLEGEVSFACDPVNNNEFLDARANTLAQHLSNYPPEDFGIWLDNNEAVIETTIKNLPGHLFLVLVSPNLNRSFTIHINEVQFEQRRFEENFEEVRIDLGPLFEQQSDYIKISVRIEFENVVNLADEGQNDQRLISGGIARIGCIQ